MSARLHVYVHGRVQGVGFRAHVVRLAAPLGLAGYARNLGNGQVEVVAEGGREKCEALLDALRNGDAPGFVGRVDASWEEPTGEVGFAAR